MSKQQNTDAPEVVSSSQGESVHASTSGFERHVTLIPPSSERTLAPDKSFVEDAAAHTALKVSSISELAKLVAWLGASAGGLTILLVVVGFLALSAHDVMLGVPRTVQNRPEYTVVGGLFFGRSIIFMVAALLLPKSWVALGILIIVLVGLFHFPKWLGRDNSRFIQLCAVGLLCAQFYVLMRLVRPLQISNLLLHVPETPNGPGNEVVRAILVNDMRWLGAEYGFLALLVLCSAILFKALDQVKQNGVAPLNPPTRRRIALWPWLRVPAFALLIISLFLLPRAYGILTISNEYPEVNLVRSNSPANVGAGESLFMLREDEKFFVLYDPSSQSIITVRRDPIEQHRTFAPQHIFSARTLKR